MKGPSEIVKESWSLGDIEFERTESFRVPVARLFGYVADLRNLPSWRQEVRKVTCLASRKGTGVRGGSFVLDVLQGDSQVEVRVEIKALEKNRLLELEISSSSYQAIELYRFEEDGGNTRLEFSFKATRPGVLVRTLALFMGSAFREDLEKKLANLRSAVEEKESVRGRLRQYGAAVHERLCPAFEEARVSYPPDFILLVGLKQERVLDVYVRGTGRDLVFIRRYSVLGASGAAGPKLREGDRQVPEGVYTIDELNPNSRFHLSLRVGYPNAFDRARAKEDGRSGLGGDIMIHGGSSSAGCLAIGDKAVEELFVLVADCGLANTRLVLSPVDFRRRELPLSCWNLAAWTEELYDSIRVELADLPEAAIGPSGGLGV
ncbi:MAG: SRPBCC family protein [Planctomycetota bacterium]|nr:SRPBCC family protein [Planctomycetota bacterium]